MQWISQLKINFLKFPTALQNFLKRSLVFFIIFQCYFLTFESKSRTLNAPLTNYVAIHSAEILNSFSSYQHYNCRPKIKNTWRDGILERTYGSTIYFKKNAILYIGDACNGLELFALYIGFILAMPAKGIRKFSYVVGGGIIIHLMNVLRCVGLILLQINARKHFDFAHHYLFKVIIYSVILMLWYFYMKKIVLHNDKQSSKS